MTGVPGAGGVHAVLAEAGETLLAGELFNPLDIRSCRHVKSWVDARFPANRENHAALRLNTPKRR